MKKLSTKHKNNISKAIKIFWNDKIRRKNASERFKGQKNPRWNNGINYHSGYILVRMINHPYANSLGYVRQHRISIEKIIGRYLNPKEKVHHINRNKTDNNINNLMVFKNHSTHVLFENENKINPKDIIFNGRNF